MITNIINLISILYSFFKLKFLLSIILNLFSIFFQTFGFALIFFYLSIVIPGSEENTNPEIFFFFKKFINIDIFGLTEFSIIIFLTFIFSSISRLFIEIFIFRFSFDLQLFIRKKVIFNFLNMKLKYQNQISKSDLNNYLGFYVDRFKESCICVLNLIQNILLMLGIMFLIYIVSPESTLIIFLMIFATFFIFFLSKEILKKYSIIEELNLKKIQMEINKVIFAFKDFVLLNSERLVIKKIVKEFNYIKKINTILFFLSKSPKYLIEITLLVSLLILTNYLLINKNNLINYFPFLSLILISSIRVLPVLSAVGRDLSLLKKNIFSVDKFFSSKKNSVFYLRKKDKKFAKPLFKTKFKKTIIFKDVNFAYDNSKSFNYNYKIKKNEWILIKGESGCGKSTFFNLLSGLITDYKGEIYIDNYNLKKKNISNFNFSFVTQDTLLFEGTFSENVCLKTHYSSKDMKLLKKVFEVCELNKFISFENFLTTKINFNAPSISGGQKQRISLARALFTEPQILLLDESLNNLDKKSEQCILKNIKNSYQLTLLYISHQNTPINFDRKIYFKK